MALLVPAANSISAKGADYANHITIGTHILFTFRHPWITMEHIC